MTPNRKNHHASMPVIALSIFALTVAYYFGPFGGPAMRLAFPVAVLALGGIGALPWTVTAGLAFSALGDACGVLGSFVGQMAAFAVAHVFYIVWLTSRLRKTKVSAVAALIVAAVWIAVISLTAATILPSVDEPAIRTGCAVYALLISSMMCLALLHAASSRTHVRALALLAAVGGVLFVISDAVLAWNRFVAHIDHSGLIIMTTYYAAQLLLFLAAWRLPRMVRAGKP